MKATMQELARKTAVPGPRSKTLLDEWKKWEAQVTGFQAPVVLDHGNGVILTDVDGNEYYDWTSGVLVMNIGHSHPDHVAALQKQAARLLNCYDIPTAERINAAKAMVEITPANLDQAFFMTTGAEAVEACIRVARRATGNFEIISFQGGFHGRTYASMSVGGLSGVKKHYGPLMAGVINVPYPNPYRPLFGLEGDAQIDAHFELMENQIRAQSTGSLAAVLIEPYQGAGGFIFPPAGFLTRLEKWAREKGLIMIVDEVQASFGRTGKWFCSEWEGLTPHLMAVGKGIGCGIPTSAMMAESGVMACMHKGEMSSTCGGNPISSASCLAIIDIMKREKLVENSAKVGAVLKKRLEGIQENSKYLGDVRGRGLIIGLEIVKDRKTKEPSADLTKKIILKAAEKGLLMGPVGMFGNVIRVAPPLVVTEDQAHAMADIFAEALAEVEK
ncbi:aspartate aminotransferase family protein [bacterium]|nr:aspartate aminotransferase family protein [bacterium]